MQSNSLPNLPWQERPAGSADVVWRNDANPIILRNLIPSSVHEVLDFVKSNREM